VAVVEEPVEDGRRRSAISRGSTTNKAAIERLKRHSPARVTFTPRCLALAIGHMQIRL
jgi:hypothetical protein